MPVPSSHCSDFITLTLCNLKSELQYPFLSSLSCFYPVVCLFVFVCLFVCLFRDRVSLNGCGCPETHSIDQAGLELRNPPASASQVLGLKACATTAQQIFLFLKKENRFETGSLHIGLASLKLTL